MILQPDLPVILASASPRRQELLKQLGLEFDIEPAHIDESELPDETPLEHVRRLAEEKGKAISRKHKDKVIISSDTIVLLDNDILGKPQDTADAARMLKCLSGQSHDVITAFSIICADKGLCANEYDITTVHFRELNDEEIRDYIEGGSPMDKAGAYGIQDLSANFVDSINGCFYNVIGFPVARFKKVWDNLLT